MNTLKEIWLWIALLARTVWMLFLCLIFGLVLLVGLFGCAAAPVAPEVATDPDCDHVAKYARAISQLRDIGVPLDQTSAYTTETVAMTFPMQYIRFAVYQSEDSPGVIATKMYATCVQQGYTHLLATLNGQERERQRQLQAQDAMNDPSLSLKMTNTVDPVPAPDPVPPAKKVKHAARRPNPAASQALVRDRQ